jgi:pullulanase
VRVRELKEAIMALHEAGIRVVLDVVYNHTYDSLHSNLNRLAPNYFYRQNTEGGFSNGSGCGNELATERPVVRKFILDSLKYWLKEYKVDGFRFDLLGLYDTETVRIIANELRKERSDIILYGEPWVGGESGLDKELRFLKTKQKGLGIGLFNDDFRNAIKGDNDGTGKGFAFGALEEKPWVELGIVASTKLGDGRIGFARSADEVVNYASAHDNLVLWDKIEKACGVHPEHEKVAMHRLALSIVLTSFGMVFIQAGTEFVRTKLGHHNSYNAGDDINMLNWRHKHEYFDHYSFIKSLIEYRKQSGFFSLKSQEAIQNNVTFYKAPEGMILYEICQSPDKRCIIVHNGVSAVQTVHIPAGQYNVIARNGVFNGRKGPDIQIGTKTQVDVEPYSTLILETKKL